MNPKVEINWRAEERVRQLELRRDHASREMDRAECDSDWWAWKDEYRQACRELEFERGY